MIPIAKAEKRKGKKQSGPCSKKPTPKYFRPKDLGCGGVEMDLPNLPNIEELDDEVFMQPDDVAALASSADAIAEAAVRKIPKGRSKKKKEVEIMEEGEIEDGATTSITPGMEAVLSEYSPEADLRAEREKVEEIRNKIEAMKAMGYVGRDFPFPKEYFRVKITTELHVVGVPHPGNIEQVGFIRCKK
jgi:hypothetical protein